MSVECLHELSEARHRIEILETLLHNAEEALSAYAYPGNWEDGFTFIPPVATLTTGWELALLAVGES